MTTDFQQVMSTRTDEQLIKAVTVERADYQPAALEAAEQEIKKRGIDITQIEQHKTEWANKIKEEEQLDENRVSSFTRFIHLMIDGGTALIVTFCYSSILGLFISTLSPASIRIVSYALWVLGFLTYYIFMESIFQKTLGKFITKTTVVNKDGSKPGFNDIVRRSFCRLIPFDRVSFLFTRNGFHDRLSDTTVVKDIDSSKNG